MIIVVNVVELVEQVFSSLLPGFGSNPLDLACELTELLDCLSDELDVFIGHLEGVPQLVVICSLECVDASLEVLPCLLFAVHFELGVGQVEQSYRIIGQ
jgi:hypothetical protein